jgi:branched-chain amino acid transport system substrate-binding protein
MRRFRWAMALCFGLVLSVGMSARAAPPEPVVVGLTAEFGVRGSQTAQSIEKGILLAIDEINAAGGVLGGRQVRLETRDDRGVPARGIDNFNEFSDRPEVVGVFCGRFSPVAIEIAAIASQRKMLLLDPWAAADDITKRRGAAPNYVFRLSLTDSWALRAMLDHARERGISRVALFVPNTAWGRSSEAALLAYRRRHPGLQHEVFWYNWGDTDFTDRLVQAREKGAQAVLTVTNEFEGLPMISQMAALPAAQRLPIISHWGLLGGDFATAARPHLERVDFTVVHSFSFSDPQGAKARAVAAGVKQRFGIDVEQLRAQLGFAHAYDLMHLLAKAINQAGSTDRAAIRHAMERLEAHEGLVRRYAQPFTPQRHEALDASFARMARFDRDGNLRSIGATK